ncbi:hypothetical protein GLOIN_2v1485098 [Rhizophagus clarus]|uniref:Uncharacterized protein n=1 Tax=Rhizophagus clarus TaxID=94130 RepID=A0A8H3MDL6_9GLOM|nr:hypothetical protein GLOIN_2v1485098 [Rhizophagus clarus]
MQSKNINKKLNKLNLQKVPKRLIEVLGLDEFAEICDIKDILYTSEELKQFESDYQKIIAQLTITADEISLSDKIKKMSSILYKNQRILGQKIIYDPDEFKIMLEIEDADLIASINNKYINGIKADIGSYLESSGASVSSIDILANIGLSVSQRTVNRQKTIIAENHQETVNSYCLQNIENIFILNIDDYHNIHQRNQPTLLKTHNIDHFVTILLNSNSSIPKIPFYLSNNISIHNPKNSYENKMKFFIIHDYDGRIQNQQELRSMKYSKLVDFILHSLYNTKDYIESANILFEIFKNIEQEDYLNNFIIPTICDWPG